jgi:ribosomal-protein-alanine N-acetyltransferase
MTKLETERLLVRNMRISDWLDLYEYLSLPATYAFEPGEPVNRDKAKRLARDRAAGNDFLAVVLKSEAKMIGHLYFHRVDPPQFDTWELGYIFHPAYQRQGYCTESCRRLVEHAFAALKAHKIVAYCDPRNPASWRVLEKIGMKREGCFERKAFFRRDERGRPLWHDCWAYGLLAPGEREPQMDTDKNR